MLWSAEKNSSAMFMTGANPNFWGFIEAAVDLKQKGLLGSPTYMEAEYIHDIQHLFENTPWRRTFPPIKYCTHSLGPLLRLIDEDLKYVSCFSTGSHMNNYPGQQDVMTAHFRTASNVVIRFTASFVNNAIEGHHYRVFGTEGYFERTPGIPGIEESKVIFNSKNLYGAAKPTELKIGYMRPEYEKNPQATGHGGADFAMFDHFFKAILNNEKSPLSLREGLRMTIPGLYACLSAERGGEVVEIKYPWENKDEE
jgi:predicted dehydrogenase